MVKNLNSCLFIMIIVLNVEQIVGQENTDKVERDTTVKYFAHIMPKFPGGDIALRRYIYKNIDYSNIGRIEPWGKAYARFVVTKVGRVENIQILKTGNVPKVIEERFIKVLKSLPRWKPGMIDGKPVDVWRSVVIWEPL